MSHTLNQLRRTLWQAQNGSSGDPNGMHPDNDLIERLVGVMWNFELGDTDITGVREAFKEAPKGFDLDLFISDMIAAGDYSSDAFEPWPEEEPEDLGPNVVPIR